MSVENPHGEPLFDPKSQEQLPHLYSQEGKGDLIMPGIDGVTATRFIHQRTPEIKIIILTSTIEAELLEQAMEAGAQNSMQKNASLDVMAATIRGAVQ